MLLHFKILKKLGAGGMGAVYLARDLKLGRDVAIKILSSESATDSKSRRRFLHEAKAQAMLSHPHVATFYEVAEHDNLAFIVMEFVEGQTLSKLSESVEMPCDEVLDLAIQIGEGLSAAHERGVIHRDIKSDNIMVTQERQVKIMDFGLARWKGMTTITKTGTHLGSACYMSPEQAGGRRVDHRTDIFSLGVVIYELLCRRRPFDGTIEAVVVHDLMYTEPQPIARYCRDAPEDLERIVMKCLAKDPDERYQSVADLVADLKHAKRELEFGQDAGHSQRLRRAPPSYPGNKWQYSIGAVVLLAIILMTIPSTRYSALRYLGIWPIKSEKRLVVIPFTLLGERPPNRVFAEGLAETITSKLTQMEQSKRSLSVVPASDVRRTGVESAGEARQAFGATHVVTGSIQFFQDLTRITVNLVDAKSEVHLNSKVIDGPPEDVTSIQDSTILYLASMLAIDLGAEARGSLLAGGTIESSAFDHYLRGRGYLQRYTENVVSSDIVDIFQLDTAVQFFGKALDADPGYALAHVGLGESYWQKYLALIEPEWIDIAIDHSLSAIELDDRLAGAYVTLATAHNRIGRYQEAVHEYKRVLKIDPVNAVAYRGLAKTYEAANQSEAAEVTYKTLIDLKPDYLRGYSDFEYFLLDHGRYEEATEQMETVLKLEPEGFDSWNRIGGMYYALGQLSNAQNMWERSLEVAPNYRAFSNLGTVYSTLDRLDTAAQMYEHAINLDNRDYRLLINLASLYKKIEEKSEAVQPMYIRAIELAEKRRAVNPRDPTILVHLAECYVEVHDSSRALKLAGEALSMAPTKVDVVVRAGLVNEQLGERETALELINSALELGYPRAQLQALPELRDLFKDSRLHNTPDGAED